MDPTPGGALDLLSQQLADPLYKIVAHLAKGPIGAQDVPNTLSALVEADFPGYAPILVSPDLESAWEESNYGEMSPFRLHFEAGAIVTPQQVTHIYYTGQYGAGAVSLVSCVPFDAPVSFAAPGDSFEVDALVGNLEYPD